MATEVAKQANRKTGIDIIGDVPWGTHFCQFYRTKEDLIEILVPYFKAGLENNEFCMWITSEPLNVEDAKRALQKKVKSFDEYINKGQMEILDYSRWYTKAGKFNADKVLEDWAKKEKQAVQKGFDGFRLTGNTFWLEQKDWENFKNYEAVINSVIGKYRMLAVCTYSLDKCTSSEIMDVVSNHQFAVIKREGKWEIIESAEHKKTAEVLRQSEKRYRDIVQDQTELICRFLPDKTLTFVNGAYCRYFGKEPQELVGHKFMPFIPKGDHEMVDKHFASLSPENPVATHEHRVITADGETRWHEWTNRAIFDEQGNVVEFQSVGRDVTQHKKAEEKVQQQNKFLNTILESLSYPFYVIDANNYTIKLANSAVNAGQLSENPTCYRVSHKQDEPCSGVHHGCPLQEVKETKKPVTIEHVHYDKDGNTRNVEVHAYPIFDNEGKVSRIIEYSLDITDRKKVEKALHKAHDELEQKVRGRTAELLQANEQLKQENQERMRAEQLLRLEEARLDALLQLSQMSEASVTEIARFTLEQGVKLTRSKIGFLGLLSEDESVYTLHAVSRDVVKECSVTGDPIQWHIAEAGIWADAIRERKTLFVNDYSRPHPSKKGLPPGHLPVKRLMVVPVFEGKRIVAVAGVGNKASDYDKADDRQITLLLNGMWRYIQGNRSKEALQRAYDGLEKTVEERTAELARANTDLQAEITESKKAAEVIRKSQRELNIRNRIAEVFLSTSDDETYGEVLEVLLDVMESQYGIFGYIDEHGALVIPSMTGDIWEQCRVSDKTIVYPREKWGGIWGRALVQKKSLYANEGLHVPEGHVPILKVLVVPILYKTEVIGCLEVGNKRTGYGENECRFLESIAGHIAPILNARLQRDIQERKRKRAEQEIIKLNEELEERVAQRTASLTKIHNDLVEEVEVRKKVEEKLRKAKAFSDSLIDLMKDGFILLDAQRVCIDVNPALCEMTGFSADELVGSGWPRPYWPPEDSEKIEKAFCKVLDGDHNDVELTFRQKDGQRFPAIVSPSWIKDKQGKVTNYFATVKDITERKKAEQTLRDSEERYREMAENLNEVVYRANPDPFEVTYVNKALKDIYGYTPKEWLSNPKLWENTIHPDDKERVLAKLANARRKSKNGKLSYRIITKDQAVRWVEDRFSWKKDKEGEVVSAYGIVSDITEHEQIRQREHEHRAELAHASRLSLIGGMTSGLAHELNQPLCAIANLAKGSLRMMESGQWDSNELLDAMDEVAKQAERAGEIIRRIRRLARKQEPRRSSIDIEDVIQEAVGFLESEARLEGVTIQRMGPPDKKTRLWADPIEIEQVFLNLLQNSLEAMADVRDRERRITVEVITNADREVEVVVSDTGRGLSPEVIGKVFDPFFTTKSDGLGIGLSISHSIIEAHDGRLWAEQNPVGGATFRFTLPSKGDTYESS